MNNNSEKREKYANYVAGALLMPKEMFYNDLKQYGFFETKSKWKRVHIAHLLSQKYAVDEIHVVKRIKEVKMLFSDKE